MSKFRKSLFQTSQPLGGLDKYQWKFSSFTCGETVLSKMHHTFSCLTQWPCINIYRSLFIVYLTKSDAVVEISQRGGKSLERLFS